MTTFRRLFIAAALSGLVAGAFAALIHHVATVPIILAAETYEAGAAPASQQSAQEPAAHEHDAHGADAHGTDAHGADGHSHGEGWAPQDGFERSASTWLADLLTGIGFALLLVSAYAVLGRPVDWRSGLAWGLAGFVVFVLAPGLGLPPELPGTAAADLSARQGWWLGTVAATAAGLGLLFLLRPLTPLAALAAVVLLVAPHLVGAPQPAEHFSLAPADLAHRFIVMTTLSGLLFWAALGALSGWLYSWQFRAREAVPHPA